MISKLGMFLSKYGPEADAMMAKGMGKGKDALMEILQAIKASPKASMASAAGGGLGALGLEHAVDSDGDNDEENEANESDVEQYLEALKKKKMMG